MVVGVLEEVAGRRYVSVLRNGINYERRAKSTDESLLPHHTHTFASVLWCVYVCGLCVFLIEDSVCSAWRCAHT